MKILEQLSSAKGVSGDEGDVRRMIVGLVEKHVDEMHTDSMGNLIVLKKAAGRSKLTVMIDAHMDEVGLMVNGYDSSGMLRMAAVGGLDDRILPGKRVVVGPAGLPGVIGVKPYHLSDADEREKAVKLDALRVDIGANSKDSAEARAPLGTRISFDSAFVDLGAMARGKAFDDRVGCSVLVHLLMQDKRYPFDLFGTFTTQEEIGSRGAQVAAHRVNPDLCLILETTAANDLPSDEDQSPNAVCGKGPALSLMDQRTIYDPRLNRWLADTAEAINIPYQYKQPGVSGTNAASIHLTQDGIPTALVYVACRYIHSPAAMLVKKDYQNAIKLASAALDRLDGAILKR